MKLGTPPITSARINKLSKRLDYLDDDTGNGNDNGNVNNADLYSDHDYYLDRGIEPPRFAYYRQVRIERCIDERRKRSLECVNDSITHDELDYYLKARLRVSPEERYQHIKKAYYFHDLSYIHQTVDDNGNMVDIVKEYGCGHWSNKRDEGVCVPECRYYHKCGRIENEEVIQQHNELLEYYRTKKAIIDIKLPQQRD